MALPTYAGQGATAAAGVAVDVVWPPTLVDDIGILLVQTSDEAPGNDPPSGWTAAPDSPQGTGPAGVAGSTRLSVYWRRALSTSEPDAVLGDSGNHQLGQILIFRGCLATGSPFDAGIVAGGSVQSVASTTLQWVGGNTTGNDRLILLMGAHATDGAANQFSNFVNAGLANITERSDRGTSAQAGGGFVLTTADKATAGAFGITTADVATSSVLVSLTLALMPTVMAPGTNISGGQFFFRRRSA